jgi:hypothetical protein
MLDLADSIFSLAPSRNVVTLFWTSSLDDAMVSRRLAIWSLARVLKS